LSRNQSPGTTRPCGGAVEYPRIEGGRHPARTPYPPAQRRMSRVTARRRMRRITPAGEITRPDTLAVEEPLEIRVRGESLTVTMRTPGNDIDLVHGFLFAESLITEAADIRTARYCAGT